MFIDLDHFKQLNDSSGHSFGDDLLYQLAERLQLSIRATDTLARPGGDEFILLARLQSKDESSAALDAQHLGDKLLQEVRQPFMLKQHRYHITASIGIALFNDGSKAIDELMSSADLAMYHSKESGRNQLYFFEPQMQQNLRQRQLLESALKQALANDEFRLFYQPAISDSGIEAHLLELELTESMLHDNLEHTRQTLHALSQLGAVMSLDDFGTGYSSLSYLKNLPISVLKIDQSFVKEFLTQDTDHAIVRTILAMAESLSLTVVAEGVEQQAQFDELVRLGCNLFQGYLFGKPAPLTMA